MTQLGKYELYEVLGRGGFGVVYRAHDTLLNVERAVKVLHPALCADPDFIERFRREAQIAARLEHPHIVPVYDLGQAEGAFYLAMKLMPGGSLRDWLQKQGALPFDQALEIARQAAAALDYAYSRPEKLVHRDLKPGNLLFDEGGAVRLADFGLAKALSGGGGTTLTASGALIGTPAYMAPELWREQPASPATDVYSLACIFVEMLTGAPLFPGESPAGLMTKHLMDGAQLPQVWPGDFPKEAESVLRRALAREARERYEGAEEFVDELGKRVLRENALRKEEIREDVIRDTVTVEEDHMPQAAGGKQEAKALAETVVSEPLVQNDEMRLLVREGDQELEMAVEMKDAAAPLQGNEPLLVRGAQPEVSSLQSTGTARLQQTQPPSSVNRPAPVAGASSPGFKLPAWAIGLGLIALAIGLYAIFSGARHQSAGLGTSQTATAQVALHPTKTKRLPTMIAPSDTPAPPKSQSTEIPGLPQPPVSASAGETWTRPADGMAMVYIPAGEFWMGSSDEQIAQFKEKCPDCEISNEQPQHRVYLDAFWIDHTEVTNAMFELFVRATGYRTQAEEDGSGDAFNLTINAVETTQGADWRHPKGPESSLDGFSEHPVVLVSWNDAVAYCEWAGVRLPSEAEWEKAARGEDGRIYPWGNIFDGNHLNICDKNCPFDYADTNINDSWQFTAPVGSFPTGASPYGLFDMAGNVWEWVQDWYQSYPGSNPATSADFGNIYRVVRGGGAWANNSPIVGRTTMRGWNPPNNNQDIIGFRCAR